MTPTERLEVYVQSAAGDAGGAIGAAYSVWHDLGGARGPVHDHAYWGPHFNNDQIGQVLQAKAADMAAQGCVMERIDDTGGMDCRATLAMTISGAWNGDRAHWVTAALWATRAAPT